MSFLVLLLLLLAACTQKPQDAGLNTFPIQDTVNLLANDGEVLARALQQSSLFPELADYPVSLIYVSKDAFKTYLTTNNLTEAEFLAHPKLYAFLGTLIVPDASIASLAAEEGAYKTSAGTTIVTSDKSDFRLGGNLELKINGIGPVLCSVRATESRDSSGTFCSVTEPPADFTW